MRPTAMDRERWRLKAMHMDRERWRLKTMHLKQQKLNKRIER